MLWVRTFASETGWDLTPWIRDVSWNRDSASFTYCGGVAVPSTAIAEGRVVHIGEYWDIVWVGTINASGGGEAVHVTAQAIEWPLPIGPFDELPPLVP